MSGMPSRTLCGVARDFDSSIDVVVGHDSANASDVDVLRDRANATSTDDAFGRVRDSDFGHHHADFVDFGAR